LPTTGREYRQRAQEGRMYHLVVARTTRSRDVEVVQGRSVGIFGKFGVHMGGKGVRGGKKERSTKRGREIFGKKIANIGSHGTRS